MITLSESVRELYDSILGYRYCCLYEDLLVPWIGESRNLMTMLSPLRRLDELTMAKEDKIECLWTLYALSRVSDYLLLPFQSTPSHGWDRPSVSRDEYAAFFEGIGFTSFEAQTSERFSPFHHEVFEVEQSTNEDDPIMVLDAKWPGLRFGEMLFSRVGVIVCGGTRHIRKDAAESSTLYFAHRRLHRCTNDLSMGWGSNSQWATTIRRDYECDSRLHYNVDGRNAILAKQACLSADRDGLTSEERLELCRNRCFICTTKENNDLWPFDDRFDEGVDG